LDETGRLKDRCRNVLASGGELYWPEHNIETPGNGARVVTAKWLPLRGSNGTPQYLLGVVEDVTERTIVEQQLQQARKKEAIGNLTDDCT
jgi:PAS domain-containing protein